MAVEVLKALATIMTECFKQDSCKKCPMKKLC